MKTRFSSFRRGFASVLSLCVAGAPVALAYAAVARNAGLNPLQIQLMSLTIYSAATQIALAQLLSADAAVWTVIITIVVLNLHYLLYGLTLTKYIKLSRFERFLAPLLLTDSVYAVAIAEREHGNFAFLLGAEVGLFFSWNLFTALGILFGNGLIDFQSAHLDFVAPLTFFVLLISMLRTRLDFTVAIFAAVIAGLCHIAGLGSMTVIIVAIVAPMLGIWVSELQKRSPTAS